MKDTKLYEEGRLMAEQYARDPASKIGLLKKIQLNKLHTCSLLKTTPYQQVSRTVVLLLCFFKDPSHCCYNERYIQLK